MSYKTILITGTAGFIGFHLAKYLLEKGHKVIGIDGLTDYYSVNLKDFRHKILREFKNFNCFEFMLQDQSSLSDIFETFKPEIVLHLAAQAGVRYSIEHPTTYLDYNIISTFNILEECKKNSVEHLLLASTSSVYGANTILPFKETDKCSTPLSFYAATKKACEDMSHSYAFTYKLPITIFRFFNSSCGFLE